VKIKTKDIKEIRTTMLAQQLSKCGICGEDCSSDPVLDHCHKTGALRAVLHRQCNAYLGRIENAAARHSVSRADLPGFLMRVAAYLSTHSADQTGLLHPTYRTPEEKLARRKVKASASAKRRREAKKNIDVS
jgi:hypothetical protein